MVDKELIFLAKNQKYAFIQWEDGKGMLGMKIVYSSGNTLEYGDSAEIISVAGGNEFKPFMDSVISEGGLYKEHCSFIFGYQPSDYENEEIKENEVKIHYAGVDNTISKKDFYELCLLLCDAKLNRLDLIQDNEVKREDLVSIKSQLEDKIKAM